MNSVKSLSTDKEIKHDFIDYHLQNDEPAANVNLDETNIIENAKCCGDLLPIQRCEVSVEHQNTQTNNCVKIVSVDAGTQVPHTELRNKDTQLTADEITNFLSYQSFDQCEETDQKTMEAFKGDNSKVLLQTSFTNKVTENVKNSQTTHTPCILKNQNGHNQRLNSVSNRNIPTKQLNVSLEFEQDSSASVFIKKTVLEPFPCTNETLESEEGYCQSTLRPMLDSSHSEVSLNITSCNL